MKLLRLSDECVNICILVGAFAHIFADANSVHIYE